MASSNQKIAAELQVVSVKLQKLEQELDAASDPALRLALQQRIAGLQQKKGGLQMEKLLLLQKTADDDASETKPLGYSAYFGERFKATPFQQYGLYTFIAAGIGFGAREFWRSHMLMRAVHEPDPSCARELMLLAHANEVKLDTAAAYAKLFRRRAILAVFGAPFLWLGYLSLSHAIKRKP